MKKLIAGVVIGTLTVSLLSLSGSSVSRAATYYPSPSAADIRRQLQERSSGSAEYKDDINRDGTDGTDMQKGAASEGILTGGGRGISGLSEMWGSGSSGNSETPDGTAADDEGGGLLRSGMRGLRAVFMNSLGSARNAGEEEVFDDEDEDYGDELLDEDIEGDELLDEDGELDDELLDDEDEELLDDDDEDGELLDDDENNNTDNSNNSDNSDSSVKTGTNKDGTVQFNVIGDNNNVTINNYYNYKIVIKNKKNKKNNSSNNNNNNKNNTNNNSSNNNISTSSPPAQPVPSCGGCGACGVCSSPVRCCNENNTVPALDCCWSTPVGQGGKLIINGCKTAATLYVCKADDNEFGCAKVLAASLHANILNVVKVSAPGVRFCTMEVNFYTPGVKKGDGIDVYQVCGNGTWDHVEVVEVRDDHVVVKLNKLSTLCFLRITNARASK